MILSFSIIKKVMKVHLSDSLTYKRIFFVVIFPIIMMVFTSLYTIVDGIFISNFSPNPSSFAAVNLIFPFIMIIGSIGFMMGAGGTALVSKKLGEGKAEEANRTFSLIIYFTIALGIVVSIGSFFLVEPVVILMARLSKTDSENLISEALLYGRILCATQVFFILQNVFQSFFMVAEKQRLGFRFVLAGGIANMIFDALFIGLFKWGVVGAALATISGYLVASVGPMLYFIFKRDNIIRLGKTNIVVKDILQSVYNGSSEFVSNIAMSVVSVIYNARLLVAYGEDGVSAYGIIMYVGFVFCAIFIGYSIGIAPFIGFNYGAKNNVELKNILKKSVILISIGSVIMFVLSISTAVPFAHIFAHDNPTLIELSTLAIRIYSIVYLACGFSIFFSSFFTALNNGLLSLIISLARTLIFQIGFLYLIPLFMGNDGIWWAVTFGEIIGAILSTSLVIVMRKRYGY